MMKYRAFSLQITQGKREEVFLLPPTAEHGQRPNRPADTQEWAKIFMSKQKKWFEKWPEERTD